MARNLELLTVGRISIDLYCDQVTPLAFALLDPPEDPQLLFRREPPAPDLQLRHGDVDADTVENVPGASRLLCSQAMPYEREVVELLEGTPA